MALADFLVSAVTQAANAAKKKYSSSGSSSQGGSSLPAATGSGGGSAGYTQKYTGGNSALDTVLSSQGQKYSYAKAAGDVAGMQAANNAANQARNQYGYAAEYAGKDIASMPKQQSGGYAWAAQQTGASGGAQQDSYADTYKQLLAEQEEKYAEIQRQQEAAKRAAVEQSVGQLNTQKTQANQNYADLFRQLYVDRRLAEKKLPQQLAAQGYSGGLTESSALGLQTSYADALRQGEQQRVNTLSGLDQAITDARLSGDISVADLAAQNAKDQLSSYAQVVAAMQDQANADRAYNFQQDQYTYSKAQDQLAQENWLRSMSRQELLDSLEREDLDYSRKLAAAQYLYENSGDASGMRMLGYSDAQIQALKDTYNAAANGTSSAGGGNEYYYTPKQKTEQTARSGANGETTQQGTTETVPAGYSADITSLGYGPISADTLKNLIASGQVSAVNVGGRLFYKKNAAQPSNGTVMGQFQF